MFANDNLFNCPSEYVFSLIFSNIFSRVTIHQIGKKSQFGLTLRWISRETHLGVSRVYVSSRKSGTMYKAVYGLRGCRRVSTPFSTSSGSGLSLGRRHCAVKQYFCGRVTWAPENPTLVVGVILLL